MREFAEQEIVIPDGPYEGRRFDCKRQPYTRLWFDAVDSGKWNRFVATGPTQSGKTLLAFVIVMLYHLFEIGESVVCGLPDMNMASDKWREDILPVIERCRYSKLLPRSGAGSRGGKIEAVKFRNGATLKFMSGGGGDKQRSGFTARVLVITETDGMDESGQASREADKIAQFLGRTRAYRGELRRVYMECTVSIEQGRTWREYRAGTASRILLPCPHCGAHVEIGRDHLDGWKDCETQVDARRGSRFRCPACGEAWSEDQRAEANRSGVLLHRGQNFDGREVIGDLPATDTLGFRWSAVNNLFVTAGDVGADEWDASQQPDEENAEKEMLQFVWAIPHKPVILDTTPLDASALTRRVVQEWTRGRVPDWTDYLTVGVDVHKQNIVWIACAWKADGTGHVVDYGVFDVTADERRVPVEAAILIALREVRDMCLRGWTYGEKNRIPDQVWLDHGYQGKVVDLFCLESREDGKDRFRPSIGRGVVQRLRSSVYAAPKKKTAVTRIIGEGYHVSTRPANVPLVEVDADHWKTWIHRRLSSPADAPGSLQLFAAAPGTHYDLCRQLTAEKQVQEMIPGKGEVVRWERIRRSNHFLDCVYNAAAAAHLCGVRLTQSTHLDQAAPVTDWFARQKRRGRRVPVR